MKILEIGGYPPPNTGWSVRIKFLKSGFVSKGHDCLVLNLGRNRRVKGPEFIDVQNGVDYLKKLIRYRVKGYHFHVHMNGQAVKGPILSLIAQLVSLLISGKRAAITFHGGIEQMFFPRKNAGKMFTIIFLNFLLAKFIICNNQSMKEAIAGYGPYIDRKKIYPIPAFSIQYLQYDKVKLPEKIERFMELKRHVVMCYIIMRNGFFVEHTMQCLQQFPNHIGFILSGVSRVEDDEVRNANEAMKELVKKGTVLAVDDMDHDVFMSVLERCDLYLRTPISDGVASSVLESLTLGVPVVASENGRRPNSVVTYNAEDPEEMEFKINSVLNNLEKSCNAIIKPEIKNTLGEEIALFETFYHSDPYTELA